MEEFRTIENMLNRNRIYSDETMKTEVNRMIQQEPMVDWNNPEDIDRWQKVFKDIELKRIRYNISRLVNKIYEKNYIIQQKQLILKTMKEKFDEMNAIESGIKRPNCGQLLYSFITRIPTEYIILTKRNDTLQLDLDFLDHLMKHITIQLPIYIEVCNEIGHIKNI